MSFRTTDFLPSGESNRDRELSYLNIQVLRDTRHSEQAAGQPAEEPQHHVLESSWEKEMKTHRKGGRPKVPNLHTAALTKQLPLLIFLELDIVSFINSTHFWAKHSEK